MISLKRVYKRKPFSRFIFASFGFYICALKTCSSFFKIHAVTLLEMIVVLNQWNMYGLTILFSS